MAPNRINQRTRNELRSLVAVYQFSRIMASGESMKAGEIERRMKEGFHGIGDGE